MQGTRFFSLGPELGYVLRAHLPTIHQGDGERPRARVAVLLDTSGSMGSLVRTIVRTVLPEAMAGMHYPKTFPVELITFDSHTNHYTTDSEKLKRSEENARGGTYMAQGISSLAELLGRHPNHPWNVIVISDGGVTDIHETVCRAEELAPSVRTRNTDVKVSAIRLVSAHNSSADTRALSCVALLGNMPDITVDNVCFGPVSWPTDLRDAIVSACVKNNYRHAELSLHTQTGNHVRIGKLPLADEQKQDELHGSIVLPGGTTHWLYIDPASVTPGQKLQLRFGTYGTDIQVDPADLTNESDIADYLETLEHVIKVWQVSGVVLPEGSLRKQNEFIVHILSSIQRQIDAALEPGGLPPIVPARERAKRLAATVRRRQGSIIARILANNNSNNVHLLNAKQQADYLHGVKDSQAGRAVTKRAIKSDADLDFDSVAREDMRTGATIAHEQKEHSALSFYGQTSWADTFEACRELSHTADDITADEILGCVGGLGVAIRCQRHGALPDPWRFQVDEVYCGQILNESDLWTAHEQGQGRTLDCPGRPGSAINGVVPLRALDAKAYDAYQKKMGGIAALHASVTMRGAMLRVPLDRIARDAAAAMCIVVNRIGTDGTPLGVELDAFRMLAEQLARCPFHELASWLLKEDPRPFLNGAAGISGILRPAAALISRADGLDGALAAGSETCGRILRSLYQLDCYMAARKHYKHLTESSGESQESARENDMVHLLGIDANDTLQIMPLFTPEPSPEQVVHYDQPKPRSTEDPRFAWMPTTDKLVALARACRLLYAGPQAQLGEPVRAEEALGLSDGTTEEMYRLGVLAQSISLKDESDRIDTNNSVSLTPDMRDTRGIDKFIRDHVRSYHRKSYEQRQVVKRKEEERRRIEQLLSDLISAEAQETFVNLLQGIPNRSRSTFVSLFDSVRNTELVVPSRPFKLFTLLTGRDIHGSPVWNSGNVIRGNDEELQPHFDTRPDLWQCYVQHRVKYGTHIYRQDDTNRHGHGNDKPSYWALGFKTMEDMRQKISPEAYATYCSEHAQCCGLG